MGLQLSVFLIDAEFNALLLLLAEILVDLILNSLFFHLESLGPQDFIVLGLLFEVKFGVNFSLHDRLSPVELGLDLNFRFGLVLVDLCSVFRLDRIQSFVGGNEVLGGFRLLNFWLLNFRGAVTGTLFLGLGSALLTVGHKL